MSSQKSNSLPKKIVIVGGGIIGCTTAYYLSHHPSYRSDIDEITILEASTTGVAQGASGKAGGLVAKWAYPRELVDVSFPEHVRLAELHNGTERWGWRYVNCGSWKGRGEDDPSLANPGSGVGDGGDKTNLEKTAGLGDPNLERRGLPDDLHWVKESLTDSYSPMAGDGETAQVHPYLFTTSMLELAQSKGVKLRLGAIAGPIAFDETNVTGVFYQTLTTPMEFVPATHAILCAGPWTPNILPSVPVKATRAHSIVIQPQPDVQISPYVLFTEIDVPKRIGGKSASPEIYARPNNEVYACGPGDKSPLPYFVDHVKVDDAACEAIFQHVASISPELRAGTVVKKQACFLATVKKGKLGGPIVGPAPRMAGGYYIATGHTCWGICNAPGTAKVLTEHIYEGKITSANLSELAPSRYASTL
ncbi:FAD dependent oxidoreductase-domain-containing protein [Thelephora terrestris]|uniref:FAD dependent oxidoreductase-domain-containing protein n=1 Tax=Thelephora terrestris TaxID=56493 RepID=A0A9P6L3R5_9AGAM|nr:FAD dependent oxidoreductase-domain-containing protein [Thelephora terrestris]